MPNQDIEGKAAPEDRDGGLHPAMWAAGLIALVAIMALFFGT